MTREITLGIIFTLLLIAFSQTSFANESLVIRKQGIQSTGGTFSVTARCNSGEVRLGGGYKLSQPGLGDDGVSVEGNYPTGSSNWTVHGSHISPNGAERYIGAEAYCMQNDNVSVQTITSPIIRAQLNEFHQFYQADSQAVCPGTKILTGGGFRTVGTGSGSGIYNAGLSSFFPVKNTSGEARGWRAAMDLIAQGQQPTLQTFVVCADSNVGPDQITSGQIVSGDIPSRTQFGYSFLGPRTLQCPAGEIASSGGYRFGDSITGHADLFVPHQILESHTYSRPGIIQRELPANPKPALSKLKVNPRITSPEAKKFQPLSRGRKPVFSNSPLKTTNPTGSTTETAPGDSKTSGPSRFELGDVAIDPSGGVMAPEINPYVDFGGWKVSGIFGSQTASQALTGYAACFKLPRVRFTVEILTPPEGFTIGPDFSANSNGTTTPPMSMTASATDANGQAVANLSYVWFVDGVLVASSASVSTPIKTQSCGVDRQTVKVVARDSSGRTASDEVSIMVGQIC